MIDLSNWLTDAEVCARLGISQATLDRMVKRGLTASKRPIAGRKPERVFAPEDIAARMPQPHANLITAPVPSIPSPVTELRESAEGRNGLMVPDQSLMMISHLVDRLIEAKREPPPYMTLKKASDETGLTRPLLRRLIAEGNLEAVRDVSIKVHRESLENLDLSSELVKPTKKRKART